MLHKFESQSKSIKYDKLSEPATLPVNMGPAEPQAKTCNGASQVLIMERGKNKVPKSMVENAVRNMATLLSILSAMLCILITVLCVKNVFQTYSIDNINNVTDAEAYLNGVYLSIMSLMALFFFVHYTFSIILLNGLETRRSKLLLVYFVFGVLVAIFGAALLSAANVWKNISVRLNMFFIFTLVTYSSFLNFVWDTFHKYEQREARQAHARMAPVTSL